MNNSEIKRRLLEQSETLDIYDYIDINYPHEEEFTNDNPYIEFEFDSKWHDAYLNTTWKVYKDIDSHDDIFVSNLELMSLEVFIDGKIVHDLISMSDIKEVKY